MKKLFLISTLLWVCQNSSSQDFNKFLKTADSIYYSMPDSSFVMCDGVEKQATEKSILLRAKLCKARYYLLKADLDESMKLLNEVIEQATSKEELQFLATAYKQKSNLLDRIGQAAQAIELLEKSIETFKMANDSLGAYKCMINAVIRYLHFNQPEKAYSTLIFLDTKTSVLDEQQSYFINQNWGLYYLKLNKPKEALKRFMVALKIAEKRKMIDSQATIWKYISRSYFETGNTEKSQESIENSIRISSDHDLMHELNEAIEYQIHIFENTGKFKEAFYAQNEKRDIEKQIYDIERINKINYYDKKLQLTEQQRLLVEKDLQLERQEFSLHKTSLQNKVMLVAIGLAALIIVIIIWFYTKTHKLNALLNTQKISLEKQNNIIADAYMNIKSSISYAKRIQEAILPPESYMKKCLNNFFIIYLPKDIVAGDFYWVQHLSEDEVMFAAADCTGHGVPGAMVSVVSNNALNRAIKEFGLREPASILDKVNELVESSFNASADYMVNDGMDIALCSLNKKTLELKYAGANNPLWIINSDSGSFSETRADKQPIGYFKERKSFTQHNIRLQQGDIIYIFTDGYADQFGGDKDKKYTYKKLREKLLDIQNKPLSEQKNILEKEFESWKGKSEQVDDVCLIGVKI